ncbi:hypothetical protein HY045_00690 [Candidatus Woesebacteria bacterium]|nr:hypothetical protein [Candidatus Woesebacteria bacterium]
MLDGLPKEAKKNLEINLYTTEALLPIAEKIASDWKALGAKPHVKVTTGVPDDYDAFLAIFDSPIDPDQYSVWHSTQTDTNISKYKSPKVDKLLEDGRIELNQENRKKIYLDFQRFLLEDSPAIFLYNPVFYDVLRK